MNQNNSPAILLLIFNRPEKVRLLMAELAKVKPARLYVSADGPRGDKLGEAARCREAREVVLQPSWPCEVITNFSDKNLGCKRAVSGGISWFFEQETEGVILEDDCLPAPSFFGFCKELLERYRQDERVMHINGTVFLGKEDFGMRESSYYFSRIPHVWGWATWARAWKYFDPEMKKKNDLISSKEYISSFAKKRYAAYWSGLFAHVYEKKVDSWAVPWAYSVMNRSGLCVAPAVNMVHNIGFDGEATHTRGVKSISPAASAIIFPLVHPKTVGGSSEIDALVMQRIFIKSLLQRAWNRALSCYNWFVKRLPGKSGH